MWCVCACVRVFVQEGGEGKRERGGDHCVSLQVYDGTLGGVKVSLHL